MVDFVLPRRSKDKADTYSMDIRVADEAAPRHFSKCLSHWTVLGEDPNDHPASVGAGRACRASRMHAGRLPSLVVRGVVCAVRQACTRFAGLGRPLGSNSCATESALIDTEPLWMRRWSGLAARRAFRTARMKHFWCCCLGVVIMIRPAGRRRWRTNTQTYPITRLLLMGGLGEGGINNNNNNSCSSQYSMTSDLRCDLFPLDLKTTGPGWRLSPGTYGSR